MSAQMSPRARGWIRSAVDYGGPLAFLVAFLITRDTIQATWALVAASAVALAVGYVVEKRIAPMPLVAGVAALIFGGLTIVFHDDRFIKIKPTVLNLGFAGFLLGGLVLKKNPLKALLAGAIHLPDPIWRVLTVRYGLFFVCVAVLNEFVWRTQSTEVWAYFRFPGLQVLAVVFSLTQVPLMMKHALPGEAPPPPPVE